MKRYTIEFGNRKFRFEFSNGEIWLIESKNSFTNFGQVRFVNFSEVISNSLLMLHAMGRISLKKI